MRVKQGTTEEKQGAVLFCIGLLFFTPKNPSWSHDAIPALSALPAAIVHCAMISVVAGISRLLEIALERTRG